ncbi:LysE family transporter [Flavobacteriaceae bacterium 3-367]|uniref:LysE family transporter n=1 Tax=Eudoraea algarum TaxID=3417568 RepID=UPI00328B0B21
MEKLAVALRAQNSTTRVGLIGIYGLLISFVGALPLGTLNITAFNIAASQNVGEALLFSFAAVFVELIIVRFTLMGDKKINFNGKLSFYILPFAVALLLYLAISSFMSASAPQELVTSATVFPMIQSSILLGVLLSSLNPLHIPFWIGWNRLLISKRLLHNSLGSYASYMVGIGIGTLGALLIFIFLGKYIFQNYQQYSSIIAWIMGCLYLGFSFYLLFLLYKKHLKLKIS